MIAQTTKEGILSKTLRLSVKNKKKNITGNEKSGH